MGGTCYDPWACGSRAVRCQRCTSTECPGCNIFSGKPLSSGNLRLTFSPGVQAYDFTFGLQLRTDLRHASDVVLAMAVARWDQEALAEVYRRNAGPAFGLARRVLGDGANAEEAVQEVFLRFWKEPARLDPDRGTLRAFLLAQVHSRAVDLLRSDIARRRRENWRPAVLCPARTTLSRNSGPGRRPR